MKFHGRFAALAFLLCLSVLLNPFRAAALVVTDGMYTWPMSTDKEITTGMYYSDGSYHGAADFSAAIGSPVYATADGVVIETQDNLCQGSHYQGAESQYPCRLGDACAAVTQFGESGGYGNYIVIDHGNNMRVWYAQLQTNSFQVKVGDQVRQGQQIASSGVSGNAYTPHLHFEMRLNDNAVDPVDYLTRTKPDMINHNPVITLESADASVPGQLTVRGWAYDPDDTSTAVRVNVYAAETAGGTGTLIAILNANVTRQDIHTLYRCGPNHGFEQTLNLSLAGTFYIRAQAVNIGEGENVTADNVIPAVFGVDNEPPTASLVSVSGISPSGYSVTIRAADNVGVTSVRMPSWVGTYTSAVPWYQAVRVGENWSCTIDRGGEKDLWHTDVRTYDAAGNQAPVLSIYLRYLTLTLDPNGGIVASATRPVFNVSYLTDYRNQTYVGVYGDYESLPVPVRRGYTFEGWYTQSTGGARVTDSTIVNATSDHTLYAHWSRSDTQAPSITGVAVTDISAQGYTVTVSATDNTGVTDVRMSSWVGSYVSGTPVEQAARSGGVWTHTVTRHDESGIWHTEIHAYDEAENASALASVYLRRITVSFNPNGGVCSTLNQAMYSAYYLIDYRNQTFVNAYGTLPVPTRTGYTFDGWYTALSGGTRVTAVSLISSEVNHTLYAHWTTPSQPSNPGDNPGPVDPGPDKPDNPPDSGDAQITVGTVTAAPGATARIPVTVSNNPGVVSMLLRVEYDNSVLTLTGVQDGGLLGNYEGQSNYSVVPYTLAWSDDTAATNHTAGGVIATLIFTVSEQAVEGAEYPVRISYDNKARDDIFNHDLQPVDFALVQGGVKVSTTLLGDVNRDNRVTALDRAALARHLAGWAGYTEAELDLAAADVNNDSRVTGLDRTILARHLAGWAGYETLPWTSSASLSGMDVPGADIPGDSAELAAVPTIVTAGSTAARNGQAAFTISLADNPGIISMHLHVSYPDALELTRVEDAGLLRGETLHDPDISQNPYSLVWDNDTATSDDTSNGKLVTLYFRLKEGQSVGSYPVMVTYDAEKDEIFNYALQRVTFAVSNSSVTYTAAAGGETADGPVSIGNITRSNGTVNVPVSCTSTQLSGNVFCAAYDSNGKLVSLARPMPLIPSSGSTYNNYQFVFGPESTYQSVNVFILDRIYQPLCSAKKQTF